jgi:hypothetical protein
MAFNLPLPEIRFYRYKMATEERLKFSLSETYMSLSLYTCETSSEYQEELCIKVIAVKKIIM